MKHTICNTNFGNSLILERKLDSDIFYDHDLCDVIFGGNRYAASIW